MTSIFTGIWPALVTPFCDGQVDHPGLARLVRHFADAGVSGLVACGSTGEAFSLSSEEIAAVVDTVLGAAGGLPVVVGVGAASLHDAERKLAQLESLPLAGILVTPPSYVRPSQQAIVAWFERLAALSPFPIILYNIPSRTGVGMELATIRTLAALPQVQAIKDCGGSAALTAQLVRDGQLAVLAGDDLEMFSTMCLGGAGAISAAAHIRPELFVRLHRLIREDRLGDARRLFHALAPLIDAVFSEPNPVALKAALACLRLIRNELRAPMLPASRETVHRLEQAMQALDAAARPADQTRAAASACSDER